MYGPLALIAREAADHQTATGGTEKTNSEMSVDVRMCKECRHIIFSKKDFAASLASRPPDVRAYENLVQFERGIRLMLPKFQKLLVVLQ
jgi:rabenosyn-5